MKTNLRCWKSTLREAERELEDATGRTTLNAAAKKLMRAKAELKRLQAEALGIGGCLGGSSEITERGFLSDTPSPQGLHFISLDGNFYI